jgi:hypothetical protein
MDLDWCIGEVMNKEIEIFNNNSVIKHKNTELLLNQNVKNKQNTFVLNNKIKKELDAQECFNLDLDTRDKIKILEILNYLSFVSNNLRTIIRNKNLITGFDLNNFENLMKYLIWLRNACDKVKKHFACGKKRDNLIDQIFKPFKTSSYKFCNYKNTCSIHKNKNKMCEKNHFVFEMVLVDIDKLIESLQVITVDNLDYINWIFLDKCLKINIEDNEKYNYKIEKINNPENINPELENINTYYIDKNDVFKCFDVISYVLNKMYEESSSFLAHDIESCQIFL